MGRRILAFFLGVIFGIILVFGAVAGGLLFAATVAKPGDWIPDSDKYLGELAQLSLYDIYNSVSALYREKLGIGENGKYFTFGDFCETYQIDPNELFGGKQVPQEVLDIPIFELIGGDREQAQAQIKVSVIPALINMFTGSDGEDGSAEPMFPDTLLEKLSAYSVSELFAENGIATVLAEVRIAEVALGMLPLERTFADAEQGTEDNSLMWAVGQAKLGPLVGGGLTGNMFLQFKEGGAFDELGKLPLTELLGDGSQYLTAFLGDNAITDLIDEEGNLNPDDILNGVYLGGLVSLQRNKLASAEGYTATSITKDNVTLLSKEDGYALSIADDDPEKEAEVYEARLCCTKEEHTHTDECGDAPDYTCGKEEHTHDMDCFGFAWYTQCTEEHDHADELVIDGVSYVPATGVYAAIADVTVGMLTSGDSDLLMSKFMNLPIGELIGDSVTVDGLLENFVNYTIADLMSGSVFDGLYLGQLLGLSRVETDASDYSATDVPNVLRKELSDGELYVKQEDGIWYQAKLTCRNEEEDHVHDESCFGYVWKTESEEDATGIYAALADLTVGELMGGDSNVLMDKVTNIPLKDLLEGQEMSGIFENLSDMTIGELMNGGIDSMYIGQLMGFERTEIEKPAGEVTELYKTQPHGEEDEVAKYVVLDEEGNVLGLSPDNKTWYQGKLICAIEEHTHGEECGVAPEYTCGKEEHSHNVAGCYGFVWTNGEEEVKDLTEVFANKQINDMNDLNGMIDTLTLSQVMGGEEKIPSQLRSLKDTTVGNLGAAINSLHVGELMGYTKTEEGWLDGNGEPVTGIMAKIADKTVEGLSTLDIMKYTLGEVMGDKIPKQLQGLKDAPLGNMSEAIDDLYLGGVLGYTQGELLDGQDEKYHWYTDEEMGTEVTGMMSKLANEKIGNLGNLNETIKSFTLNDVMGEDIPDVLKSLGDTELGNMNEAINNMYLGDFFGYEKGDELEPDSGKYVWTKDGETVTGMMGKLANEKVSNLGNLNETIQTFTLSDVMGKDIPAALQSLADVPLSELGGKIDQMYLGALLKYVRKPVDTSTYTDVANTDGQVKQKPDTDSYARLDGETWYDATLNCTNKENSHTHNADCYRFNWYTLNCTAPEHGDNHDDGCYTLADGILGRIARLRMDELSGDNLTNIVNDTPLGDVLDLENSNGLLKELAQVKIGELSGELDAIYVGIAMNYKRKQVDVSGKSPELVVKDETPGRLRHDQIYKSADGSELYFLDTKHNVYYEAQLTCKQSEGRDHSHNFTCYGFVWYNCFETGPDHVHGEGCEAVKGLNGKISNLRIDELNGTSLSNIATSLTIGDLIDSGMMEMNDNENIYKLAVVFCPDEITTIGDYITQNALSGGNLTFEKYWRDKHSWNGELTSEQIEHRDVWKQIPLKDFISTLLNAFTFKKG